MSQLNGSVEKPPAHNLKTILMVAVFLLIAAAGLTYVKWWPYYHKAISAITSHTIGSSILTGGGETLPDPSWSAAWDYAVTYYKAVWKAALLGIVLGSLVQVLIPSGWLLRVLGNSSMKSTAIGGLASVPGMMCSCCAAPIAVGMRKKHVSAGASLAFWLGNPMINPATLIFMTAVLSWKFTLLRLVFGLILTFGVSYWAGRLAKDVEVSQEDVEKSVPHEQKTSPLWRRWLASIWTMTVHIVPAYFVSVLVLGAARAWLFPTLGDGAWNSLFVLVVFCIAGALFVIPTAAEIPIAQTFLSLGFGAGPAAALLVVLPAVSLPSLLMIRRSFPPRVVGFVFASVVVLGMLSGIVGMLVL
ncbi:permease [Paenibacillus xanthanilyticus]|uniref:Permease n=1 Tax=Paenibacillus xanthanilyticus TaxID=1783531 RepID=A0ABV8KCR1_9BACL